MKALEITLLTVTLLSLLFTTEYVLADQQLFFVKVIDIESSTEPLQNYYLFDDGHYKGCLDVSINDRVIIHQRIGLISGYMYESKPHYSHQCKDTEQYSGL